MKDGPIQNRITGMSRLLNPFYSPFSKESLEQFLNPRLACTLRLSREVPFQLLEPFVCMLLLSSSVEVCISC